MGGLREEDFSRIFISFPDVFLTMLMYKNECMEGPDHFPVSFASILNLFCFNWIFYLFP